MTRYYVKHAANALPVTKDCPCEFCRPPKPEPLCDALGNPVPEWAAEAFAILSADGRRVFVIETGGCDYARPPSDVVVLDDGVSIYAGGGDDSIEVVTDDVYNPLRRPTADTVANCARRALAMEAERELASKPRIVPENWNNAEIAKSVIGHAIALDAGLAACLRCGGPAGFLGIRCERVGGCRTAEERVAAMEPPEPVDTPLPPFRGERGFCIFDPRGSRSDDIVHPTREGAIAAWREAMLARERGR